MKAILTGIRSDSHTWNLIFMELWLREQGLNVTNLGSCVSGEEIVAACRSLRAELLVVSTVNGHGGIEGQEIAHALRESGLLDHLHTVIGGKLATRPERESSLVNALSTAGFDQVLIGDDALDRLSAWIVTLFRQQAA